MYESFVLLPTYFYIFCVFYKEIWFFNNNTNNTWEDPHSLTQWVGTYIRGTYVLRSGALGSMVQRVSKAFQMKKHNQTDLDSLGSMAVRMPWGAWKARHRQPVTMTSWFHELRSLAARPREHEGVRTMASAALVEDGGEEGGGSR